MGFAYSEVAQVNPLDRIRRAIVARYGNADMRVVTNVSFVVAIVLSALILVAAGGYGWWSATLAPAVEVDGSSISKSEAKARADIASFKLGIEESRVRARIAAGTLSVDEGNAALKKITDARTNLGQRQTSDMVDALAVANLARERGVSIEIGRAHV